MVYDDNTKNSMLDKIIQFAQESLHPIHNENDDDDNYMNYAAIPTLTQFLFQHAPPLQVITHLLQQPFSTTNNKNTNTINNNKNKESTVETSKLRQKKS